MTDPLRPSRTTLLERTVDAEGYAVSVYRIDRCAAFRIPFALKGLKDRK